MTGEAADAETREKDATPESQPVDPAPIDDERLRELIRAELDRQHALPIGRRTLELIAEAEAEPASDEQGYRIVDRSGETRWLRDGDAAPDESTGAASTPMTLRDLVGELRERYPDLFFTPPDPKPDVDAVPQPPPEPEHDALADVKAAGARFVETQAALTKSFATTSAERGRTLASAAGGRFAGWRKILAERLKTKPVPALVASEAAAPAIPADEPRPEELPAVDPPPSPPETADRSYPAEIAQRGPDALPAIDRRGSDLHRIAFIGLCAATVLAFGGIVLVNLRRDADPPAAVTEPPRAEAPGETPQSEARSDGKGDTKIETAPPVAEAKPVPPEAAAPEDAEAAPVEEAPRNPNEMVGVPQVIDTATLKLSGKIIHLFGVEWVRGGQADELTKYIHGREVTCRPASGSSAFLCSIDGRDLSEVVLFNGGGRASSEASPDLVAAEDHARTERLGVWKR